MTQPTCPRCSGTGLLPLPCKGAQLLRAFQEKHGLSLVQVARLLETSSANIVSWRSGQKPNTRNEDIIERRLGIPAQAWRQPSAPEKKEEEP